MFLWNSIKIHVLQSPVLGKHYDSDVPKKWDEKWTTTFELWPFTIITMSRLFGLSAGPN